MTVPSSSHLGSWDLVSIFPFPSSLLYLSLFFHSLLIDFPLYPSFFYFVTTSLLSLCFPFSSFSSSISFPSSFTSFESFTRPLSHRTYLPLFDSIGTYYSFTLFRLRCPKAPVWLLHVVWTVVISFFYVSNVSMQPLILFPLSVALFNVFFLFSSPLF